jgi:hypothetical protein
MQLKQKVSLLSELAVFYSICSRQFWRESGLKFNYNILTFQLDADYQSFRFLVFARTSNYRFYIENQSHTNERSVQHGNLRRIFRLVY